MFSNLVIYWVLFWLYILDVIGKIPKVVSPGVLLFSWGDIDANLYDLSKRYPINVINIMNNVHDPKYTKIIKLSIINLFYNISFKNAILIVVIQFLRLLKKSILTYNEILLITKIKLKTYFLIDFVSLITHNWLFKLLSYFNLYYILKN